jgi:hypothetical protein
MMEYSTSGKTLTSTGMIIGTPEYMAPEMASGERIDYRADIYELGIILFQMLSGQVPFTGTSPISVVMKQIQEPLPLLHQSNPTIPVAVDAVIQKATAKRREDRYTSTKEMAQAFRAAIAQPATQGESLLSHEQSTLRAMPPIVASPPTLPSYNTPPAQQRPYPNTLPPRQNLAGTGPSTGGYTPPTGPYDTPYPPMANRKPSVLLILVAVLLVLVLIIGGVLVGLQLGKGTTGTNPPPNPTTAVSTSQPAATTQTTPTQTTPTPGVTPTPRPTPTPNPTPTPTTAPQSGVPLGTLLYTTSTPGKNCDTGGGQWDDYNAVIVCGQTNTRISNPSHQALNLAGTFLIKMPGYPYPSNYVIHAQMQQISNSASDFGIFFRNQSGNQPGVYSFMIHPDGTWSSYVYDNVNGNPTQIASGPSLGDAHARVTLDIVVNGSHFTFYVNGQQVGSISDTTYPTGTAGIVLDQSGTIVVSQFALYSTQG